jgi:hypothetical protein
MFELLHLGVKAGYQRTICSQIPENVINLSSFVTEAADFFVQETGYYSLRVKIGTLYYYL